MSYTKSTWTLLLPCFTVIVCLTATTEERLPPTVVEPKTTRTVYIGQYENDAKVYCKAEGKPAPTMAWYKNGVKLTSNDERIQVHTDGTLVLESFYSFDDGYFQCRATNPYGTSLSQLVHIMADTTTGGSDEIRWAKSSDIFNVIEGDPYSLPCDNAPKTARAMRLRWYYGDGNNELPMTERMGIDSNGTLHFAYTKREDEGKYICGLRINNLMIRLYPKGKIVVKRRDDSQQDVDAKPVLSYSTNEVKAVIGESLTIQCFFSAKPEASITWKNSSNHDITENNNPRYKVEDFGRQLVIKSVKQLDEGQYICTGRNFLGSEKSFITVNVTSPPRLIQGGVLTSQTVPDKRDHTLHCKTKAALNEHLDTPKWYRNGIFLNQRNVPSSRYTFSSDYTELHISDLDKQEDTANFQCNTSNSEGYLFYDAYLRVINSIVVSTKPADINEIEYGDVVDITIQANGDSCCPINKLWFFNGTQIDEPEKSPAFQKVPGTDRLLFNTSLVSEEKLLSLFGVYTCRVSNHHQSVSVQFNILPKASKSVPQVDPKTSSMEIWWIGLVAGLVLIIIVVVIVILIYKSNYPGETYALEEQEIKHNLNPEEDLLNQSFHEI